MDDRHFVSWRLVPCRSFVRLLAASVDAGGRNCADAPIDAPGSAESHSFHVRLPGVKVLAARIVDVTGRIVRTLEPPVVGSGGAALEWNGRREAAGRGAE